MQNIMEHFLVFNPLINNLQDLKDEELQKKIEDLQNKYFIATSEHIKNQIIDLLDIYNSEILERQKKRYYKEVLENSNSELYDLINIK